MIRRLLSTVLITTLLCLANTAPLSAQTYTTAELQKIAKVKQKVAKLSSASKPQVIVWLEGGEEIKGYLSSFGENSFVLEQKGHQGTTEIPYFQVKNIRKTLSTEQKVAMAGLMAGVGVGVLYGAAFLLSKCGPCIE